MNNTNIARVYFTNKSKYINLVSRGGGMEKRVNRDIQALEGKYTATREGKNIIVEPLDKTYELK